MITKIYLLIINIVTFVAFGVDKARARRDLWRISEATLLGLSAVGGAPGALAGMYIFHHKTRKPLFKYGVFVLFAIQCAIFINFDIINK